MEQYARDVIERDHTAAWTALPLDTMTREELGIDHGELGRPSDDRGGDLVLLFCAAR